MSDSPVSKYIPYPAYKDSGVDWLGAIPQHWNLSRLKYIAAVSLSNIDKKSYPDEDSVYLCNYVDVYYNDYITNQIKFMVATATKRLLRKPISILQ